MAAAKVNVLGAPIKYSHSDKRQRSSSWPPCEITTRMPFKCFLYDSLSNMGSLLQMYAVIFCWERETEIAEYNSGSQHLQNSTCHCAMSCSRLGECVLQVSTRHRLFPHKVSRLLQNRSIEGKRSIISALYLMKRS